MGWLGVGNKASAAAEQGPLLRLESAYGSDGIQYSVAEVSNNWFVTPEMFGGQAERVRFLSQLEEEGFADSENGVVHMSWDHVFQVMESADHGGSFSLLELPSVEHWRLSLGSTGGLADGGFSIFIDEWRDAEDHRIMGDVQLNGAVISVGKKQALLPKPLWETVSAVIAFHREKKALGDAADANWNRRSWAAIRDKARRAKVELSNFLLRTVVLTPEKLDIRLRKAEGSGSKVVEVMPGFEGEPERWLEMFDRFGTVQESYNIPNGEGMVQVLISPEVSTVLAEIKRMDGRRVAGSRAEAFLRNPFATLGSDASTVVDPIQFEQAREAAGIAFARFTAKVRSDPDGYPYEVTILIEEMLGCEVHSEYVRLETPERIDDFLKRLDAAVTREAQCFLWKGYELEILGDTPYQADQLRAALQQLRTPKGFKISEILDLSNYSERVGGFGEEKPYYSPFIAKKNQEGEWFPENVEFGVCYTPEGSGQTVALVFNDETLADFKKILEAAKAAKQATFTFPGCPIPIAVNWAEGIVATIGSVSGKIGNGTFDPPAPKTPGDEPHPLVRQGLVVKPNVDKVDYEERRGELGLPQARAPRLPSSLKGDIQLKDHQLGGVSWLQHLFAKSPNYCRGALLADDMGLGKTIQLLTFMVAELEQNPNIDPFLVVAPVSLLDNWKEEIEKFFSPGALPLLTLYGPALSQKRLPRKALDQDLSAAGITKLLQRDWVGDAKLVLTTYETLRDLEFSLAMQRWSVMVCDEAQKIKNPNAMVTRAAKKQNARFKIACTGTPVENTLTDIWCIFDFVQPGLLGALKEFGVRYRKPIEAESDEEKACVDELSKLIDPQIMRRLKSEVAKDLPRKVEVPDCRNLPLSDRQRALYADAVGLFKRRPQDGTASGIENHLGLLQYLRRLCSDPHPPGHTGSENAPVADLIAHSPKMAWLLTQLEVIRTRGEKVIIFCEFRNLQRVIQRAIAETFGITPDIINGETSSISGSANNRQKRIQAFQMHEGFGAIVLSPLAVGFGVNIQSANHVVHFTRTWNPAKEDQATDRAYRIGQTKDVYVYYPVVVADFLTFDAKLDTLLTWKRNLSANMLNGAGDIKPSDFSDLGAPGGTSAFGNERITADDIWTMDPDAFEAFCAILWSKQGYSKTLKTPKSGDGGIDVIAISGMDGVLIQCKSSSIARKELGWDGVKDVVAGAAAYKAKFPGVQFSLVVVTNQRFNGTARLQAKVNSVELVDGDALVKLVKEMTIHRSELTSFLFQESVSF